MIPSLILAALSCCTAWLETDDCFISFVEHLEAPYVVKQIKDPSPDEQFLLILDCLGCEIAETAGISMNKVTFIPPFIFFVGKKRMEFPATVHTKAQGVSTDRACRYHDIDIHQRYRRKNSPMWHRFGPLPQENTGLTMSVIQNMAKHVDLPRIVSLDTFVGNADRSSPNLFYDELSDSFCGIDMAASFCSPLSLAAYENVQQLLKGSLNLSELSALADYGNTLEWLIQNWPPEKQKLKLLDYAEKGGFMKGGPLFDEDVAERIEFHKKNIEENYGYSIKLLELIKMM